MHNAMARVLALLAALSAAAAGCLGAIEPAGLPQAALTQEGWSLRSEESDARLGGLVDVLSRAYAPVDSRRAALGAGVTVVTVTDVPLVDEARFLPDAIASVEQDRGVRFVERGGRSVQTSVGAVEGTEYDVEGAGVAARALLFLPPCPSFVVVIAYGALERGPVLLGGGADLYEDAVRVARHAACSAG